MTSTPRWSDHQTGKRRAETSPKHPRQSQGSGAGGQWRAGPARLGDHVLQMPFGPDVGTAG